MIVNYTPRELAGYINWIYFFHAWGLSIGFSDLERLVADAWPAPQASSDGSKKDALRQLSKDAQHLLQKNGIFKVKGVFRLLDANADGDNIIAGGVTIPFLRQQEKQPDGTPYLCLSDFIRPLKDGIKDKIGIFATTASIQAACIPAPDDYQNLLLQTLACRLAEAAAEKMHEYVRKEAWGYAKEERLSMKELHQEKFQGIRPAVGYPSIPDQSINFLIDQIIDMRQIGITLTESGAMHPQASVSGFMISHPQAHYCPIGQISSEQLADYASRRGFSTEKMKPFLCANLT